MLRCLLMAAKYFFESSFVSSPQLICDQHQSIYSTTDESAMCLAVLQDRYSCIPALQLNFASNQCPTSAKQSKRPEKSSSAEKALVPPDQVHFSIMSTILALAELAVSG
jgi:hypothetical protein